MNPSSNNHIRLRKAVEVFGEWAENNKDFGMERNHAAPVQEMLNYISIERKNINKEFSFLDVGCGNGWVVRKASQLELCKKACGIDGAHQMISKANAMDNLNTYMLGDLNRYKTKERYDVIHSMEVLYYLDNPSEFIKDIYNSWLKKDGRLIIGIDLYFENADSHSWEENVGTKMHMMKADEWVNIFKSSGFSDVKTWYSNQKKDWNGTLILTGLKS